MIENIDHGRTMLAVLVAAVWCVGQLGFSEAAVADNFDPEPVRQFLTAIEGSWIGPFYIALGNIPISYIEANGSMGIKPTDKDVWKIWGTFCTESRRMCGDDLEILHVKTDGVYAGLNEENLIPVTVFYISESSFVYQI
jgi:hypothetical protein